MCEARDAGSRPWQRVLHADRQEGLAKRALRIGSIRLSLGKPRRVDGGARARLRVAPRKGEDSLSYVEASECLLLSCLGTCRRRLRISPLLIRLSSLRLRVLFSLLCDGSLVKRLLFRVLGAKFSGLGVLFSLGRSGCRNIGFFGRRFRIPCLKGCAPLGNASLPRPRSCEVPCS